MLTVLDGNGVDFSSVSLIDIEGDGDLELTAIGRKKFDESTFLASSTVYDNVGVRSNPNTPPAQVTGLSALVNSGTATLSWDTAVDFPIGDALRENIDLPNQSGYIIRW